MTLINPTISFRSDVPAAAPAARPPVQSESIGQETGLTGDQASQLRDLVRRQQMKPPAGPELRATPAAAPRRSVPSVRAVYREARPIPGRARVIAITSGKGGVGKTNLAVNLAARFAQAGRRTILLDADMGLANADVLCGIDLKYNLAHVIARRKRLTEVIADTPAGFRLVGGASGLARMADLPDAEHRRLVESLAELERSCDTIFIDTGAGISANVLSFTRCADHVLVVTTPEPTAITDAYATIKVMCRDRDPGDQRPISLLVNQVRSASEAQAVHERIAKVVRQFLGVTLGDAGFLPHDPAVGKAVRQRSPFLLSHPKSAASVCVTRLAMRLEAGIADTHSARREGFFGLLTRALGTRQMEAPARLAPA